MRLPKILVLIICYLAQPTEAEIQQPRMMGNERLQLKPYQIAGPPRRNSASWPVLATTLNADGQSRVTLSLR